MKNKDKDLEPVIEEENAGGGLMFLVGVGVLVLAFMNSSGVMGLIGGVIICFALVVDGVASKAKEKQEKEHQAWVARQVVRKKEIAKIQYDEICSTLNKPSKVEKLMLKTIKGSLKKKYGQQAIYLNLWFENDELTFVMTQKCAIDTLLFVMKDTLACKVDDSKLNDYIYVKKIPVESIKFYQKSGDIQREVKITGGGGGGSSIEGAVVGGLIAGEAGAVIGSRKKTDPIKSETVVHDEREVVLYYYENENDTILQKMTFFEDAYKIFLSWIPGKEYQAVNATVKAEQIEVSVPTKSTEVSTNTLTAELLELVKLKESGVLTEEEFVLAKKKMLGS